jgi:hypothetical protein
LLLVGLLVGTAGCASPGRKTALGTVLGSAIGAGAGAIVGHQSGHGGSGTAIGAGVGALAGGLIGNAMDGQDEERDAALAQSEARTRQEVRRARAAQELSVLDVIRMSQAGVSDSLIISKMNAVGAAYRLSASEIIDLQMSGVSDRVIQRMIDGPPRRYVAAEAAVSPVPTACFSSHANHTHHTAGFLRFGFRPCLR